MEKLKKCYEKLNGILGSNIDSFDVVKTVQEYREYWKPEMVKILLLAESHRFTSNEEFKVHIHPRTDVLPKIPRNFTKFVYCLGYGESEILTKKNLKNQ